MKSEHVLGVLDLTRDIERREDRKATPSGAAEAARLELLALESLHGDGIRAQPGRPIEKRASALTMMALKGMVRQAGERNSAAVREDHTNYTVGKG